MIYLDTETCGLHGMAVLIQWAEDDGPVHLHEVWCRPAIETMELIEFFVEREICFFNAAFDWFHLVKLYTTFSLLQDKDKHPEDCIPEIVEAEERARFVNICLKPKAALDLMLQARKGKYQSLMAREPVRIRRVPTQIAFKLAEELEKRVQLDGIYFAKQKDKKAPRWRVYDVKKDDGTVNPHFKDVVLRFKASGALKVLCQHIFKLPTPVLFREIEVPREFWPVEHGFAPFAKAVINDTSLTFAERHRCWPHVIKEHLIHWRFNADARKYAANDIELTRRLHKEFFNSMPAGDDDSELACMVAACRWRGYAIDVPLLKKLRDDAKEKIKKTPVAPKVVKRYVTAVMDDMEKLSIRGSTKKQILEEIATWTIEDDSGKEHPHPAASRAKEVLEARAALKEIELYDKLILAGRFHASFKVIGALSSRMSGSDGLNAQGIKHDKYVRAAFYLSDPDDDEYELNGGDFKSFEVSIAAAVFKDEGLTNTIKSGIKIHAILGQELWPHYTYEEILKSDGNATLYPKEGEGDMYDKGKKGVFLMIYGGDENTFKNKLGIELERGKPALDRFMRKFPGVLKFGKWVFDNFAALRQPGGIGTAVQWHPPKEYAETFLGFKRFFTLENDIAKVLFGLAEKPPKEWLSFKMKVQRRAERIQTASGAARSALYGAAFGIISATIRAAKNHYIQSPGAMITKAVQRAIWDLQPAGVHEYVVRPMNIHDELMVVTKRTSRDDLRRTVFETVEKYKAHVPLLGIDWVEGIDNWAGKKGKPVAK